MTIKRILLSFLVLIGLVAPAAAGQIDGPSGSGVSLYVPDGWKAQAAGSGGEGILALDSPAGDASLLFVLTDAAKLDKALKGLDGLLSKVMTNAKMGKPSKLKINGMPALAIKGTAKKVAGGDIGVMMVIVQTPTNKALIAMAFVDAAKLSAYKATFGQVLSGIKPAK